MNEIDLTVLTIKMFQSVVVLITGLLALYYNKRLSGEMGDQFRSVYGRLFKIGRVFDSKIVGRYLRFLFILYGVCAIGFAVFNTTGPID